ncbi:MAG: hypothetical protein ACREHV_14645, partial [Rhizomicrobium sp.]
LYIATLRNVWPKTDQALWPAPFPTMTQFGPCSVRSAPATVSVQFEVAIFELAAQSGPCHQSPLRRSQTPEESQVESCEHQDNADIHYQPFPESVSEEHDI